MPTDENSEKGHAEWEKSLADLDIEHKDVAQVTPQIMIRALLDRALRDIEKETAVFRSLSPFESDCARCLTLSSTYVDSYLQTLALKKEKIQAAHEWLDRTGAR